MTTVPSHEETGENHSPAASEESAPAPAMEVVPARHVFPPGYRFMPKDDELITYYLKRKINNEPIPIAEMSDVELYKHSPKKLSESYPRLGENVWYFFTPRERKYKNGSRPNRAAGNGFWKATGADKHVYDDENNCVGYRKALVFYEKKADPSGDKTGDMKTSDKTNWIMHEYRVIDQQTSTNKIRNADNGMRLDDWVLSRIYEKAVKPEKIQKKVEAERDVIEAEAGAIVNVAAGVEVNNPSPVTEESDTPTVDSPVDQNPTENQFQNIPEKVEHDHMSFDPHMCFEDHHMILHEFLEPPRVEIEYLPAYDFGMNNLTECQLINTDFFNLDIKNNQFTSPSYNFVGHPTSTSTSAFHDGVFHDGSSSSSFHAAPSTNAFADDPAAGASMSFADSLIKSEDCNSDVRPTKKTRR